MLYLVMYITGHVHVAHSSTAMSGRVSGTHPLLELDELSAVRAHSSHQRAARRARLVPGVSGGSRICGGQGVCACACVCVSSAYE